jgi:aryl-alcohol dehydrogenase-like predicted oxidoreductase
VTRAAKARRRRGTPVRPLVVFSTLADQVVETPMKFHALPGTELKVSEVCLGTMTWGEQNGEAEAHAQLDHAIAQGINFIDTAEMYPVPPDAATQGRTEAILGRWLASRPHGDLVIATKVAGPGRRDWIRGGRTDLTCGVIAEAVDTSLARLRIDCIDLYQIHWPQRNVPMFGATEFDPAKERDGPSIREQVEGMAAMIKAGKIRYYGLSNETAWGVCEFRRVARELGLPGPVTLQNSYSVMSRGVDNDLAEVLFRERMSLLAYSPLAGGMLSGKYLGGARPPNVRFTLFDGLGMRFRKPIVDEAIAAVHKIKDAGMWGVKFYTSMTPAWIAPAAAEAHKLGLHVHGHVPAGMRLLDAVRAGYDEVTHINFIMMQAMPQEVVDKANTAARLEGPAKYGKDVDLDSPSMKAFYAELSKRGTIVDPTLTVWEPLLTSDGSTVAPEYSPYIDVVPAPVARSLKISGYPLFDGVTREDFRKSFDKMVGIVNRLHSAGVRIVAGTDGYGLELVRELELYHQAGLSNAEAMQTATIVPARMTGMDKTTGSIEVGKDADMLLVEGDPMQDLHVLHHITTILNDGYRLDAAALREASGISGMPK